jgi:uncharacterized protein (DUF1330 family)
MTVYITAQITIKDRATYNEYVSRFMGTFVPFGGKLLAVDENVKTLEGEWPHTRFVLASFPDEVSFRAWWDSPAYRDIVKYRQAASDGTIILAQGFPPT